MTFFEYDVFICCRIRSLQRHAFLLYNIIFIGVLPIIHIIIKCEVVVLKVRDMYEFRKRWAEDFGENYLEKLSSYVGSIYEDDCGNKFKGFFGFVNGAKGDIEIFLNKEINLTGSYQVIYELIQNANDANSDRVEGGELLVYYNDKYLLFANNGKPFSEKNIRAICNVGQSDKNKIENKTSSGVSC